MAQQRGMKRAQKVLKRQQKKARLHHENAVRLQETGAHAGHSHSHDHAHDHDHDHDHEHEHKEEKPKAKKATKKKEA